MTTLLPSTGSGARAARSGGVGNGAQIGFNLSRFPTCVGPLLNGAVDSVCGRANRTHASIEGTSETQWLIIVRATSGGHLS